MSGIQLAQSQSPPTLDSVVRRIQDISTLPQIALRIMEVANDPKSGAYELKEVMEDDAALSARVLRSVNSSGYATRSKITNLQQAIAYLGSQQIRNLAIAASTSKLFADDKSIGSYNRAKLWRHLVSVGICSRLIAMRLNFSNFEDVFLAGLLHDIGIIFEDQQVHQWFTNVAQSLKEGCTLSEVERTCLGFDHMTLGEAIAKHWRFAESVTTSIRHHHNASGCRSEHVNIVRCVEMANLICSIKGMPSVGLNLIKLPRTTMSELSLGKEDLVVLAADLDRELAASQTLFQT